MKTLHVKLTLEEEMLGMSPANPEIYSDFIASNAPDAATRAEEIEVMGIESVAEKGMTIFPKDSNGNPFLWDYQIKGAFKDAAGMLRYAGGKDENGKRLPSNESCKMKAYKKLIDGCIFVYPRRIPLVLPEGGEMGTCQRPLRAQTAQGERVALACSETVPAGTTMDITIMLLNSEHEAWVIEMLDYFSLRGIGAWRNSGKGIVSYEIIGGSK